MRLGLALSLAMFSVAMAAAQEKNAIPLPNLIVSEPIPTDYGAVHQELKAEDKVTGHRVVVSKQDQVSKVVLTVQLGDLTSVATRRATAKAYINGLASTLVKAGFKVVEKKLPDIDNEQFTGPVSVDLVFANDEGKKIWVHEEIFFTNNGFLVQVIADDPDAFASLTKWSKTIKPKPAS